MAKCSELTRLASVNRRIHLDLNLARYKCHVENLHVVHRAVEGPVAIRISPDPSWNRHIGRQCSSLAHRANLDAVLVGQHRMSYARYAIRELE